MSVDISGELPDPLDNLPFKQPCAVCGATIRATIRAGKGSQVVRCPNGHEATVDASQLRP